MAAGQDRRVVRLRDTKTFEIVGREAELASVCAVIDQVEDGPAVLVLDGEAGIGKSTLWLAGVEHARTRGLRVLSSRPAKAERSLAYAGLADLFEDALDDTLPSLAPPRRHALEIVMLRAETQGDPIDQRAVVVAVRDVLQQLSDSEPLVIAVDDVQWLDPSSSGALTFVNVVDPFCSGPLDRDEASLGNCGDRGRGDSSTDRQCDAARHERKNCLQALFRAGSVGGVVHDRF